MSYFIEKREDGIFWFKRGYGHLNKWFLVLGEFKKDDNNRWYFEPYPCINIDIWELDRIETFMGILRKCRI